MPNLLRGPAAAEARGRGVTAVGDLIRSFFRNIDMGPALTEAMVVEAWNASDLPGRFHARAIGRRGTNLLLRAENPVAAEELRLRRAEALAALHALPGGETVNDIRAYA